MAVKAPQPKQRSLLVLYGSETGNSEDAAEDIGRMAKRLHFQVEVTFMDAISFDELLHHHLVLFVLSTTGQGEFPKHARSLWKSLLRKRLRSDCLSHMDFTTFGLGDTSYPKYNLAARKLHKRLEQLGAKEFYPRGEADDQHPDGIDSILLPWVVDLEKHLITNFPLPLGCEILSVDTFLKPPIRLWPLNGASTMEMIVDGPGRQLGAGKSTGEEFESPSKRSDDNTILDSAISAAPSLDFQHPQDLSAHEEPDAACGPSTKTPPSPMSAPATVPQQRPLPMEPAAELHGSSNAAYLTDTPSMVKERTTEVMTTDTFAPDGELLSIPGSHPVLVLGNERITPKSHWQDVRLVTLEVPIEWQLIPGDSVTIYPKNFPEDVQHIIDRMNWGAVSDVPLAFIVKDGKRVAAPEVLRYKHGMYLVSQTPTLRQLLTSNLDINAIPKRSLLADMVAFTSDETEKERLREFCNPAMTDEYYDYATRPRRTILELLDDFPSCQLDIKYICHFFPIIRGRQYSICSGGILGNISGEPDVKRVELIIALVRYRTVIRKIRQGLCSRYIDTLEVGTEIQVTVNRNPTFYPHEARQHHQSLLMIAGGTGIAPLRSLIWTRAKEELDFADRSLQRALQKRDLQQQHLLDTDDSTPTSVEPWQPVDDPPCGEKVLIFGCRNRSRDFFFANEWQQIPSLKVRVLPAFSRDQEAKEYVQDVVRRSGALVARMLEEDGALVYVCGSSGKMPMAVRLALVEALMEHGMSAGGLKDDRGACEVFLAALERSGRYIQETW